MTCLLFFLFRSMNHLARAERDRCMNAKKHPMLHLGKWVLFRGYFSRVPEASLEALALDPVPAWF